MAVKTITVTTDAYEALKELKGEHESFSQTILRVAKKKSLWDFAGILTEEEGERLEKAIKYGRREHRISYEKRIARITRELEGKDGNP
jgi:predicted CopG family antitoxin